jgi:hypothetical protein
MTGVSFLANYFYAIVTDIKNVEGSIVPLRDAS